MCWRVEDETVRTVQFPVFYLMILNCILPLPEFFSADGKARPDVATPLPNHPSPKEHLCRDYAGVQDTPAARGRVNSGLPGANILALAVNPVSPQTIYAGTDGNGVYRSNNCGASWTPVNTGLTNPLIKSLAIDPAVPQTVYAGTDGGGVFKSTNGGTKWKPVNSGLTCPYIAALVVDPATPETIYAGTIGGGVFRSINGGTSWTAVNKGLPRDTATPAVYSLAVNPANPSHLCGSISERIYER